MKKNLFINIYSVLFLCLISRVVAYLFFSDLRIDNEWGKLVHNLSITGILGINVYDGVSISHAYAQLNDKVMPSVFMPPLYAYFIYIIKLFTQNTFELVKAVIIVQIIISLLSTYIFFKILINFTNHKFSILLSLIFCLFPINIYSVVQISSVSLQIFLLLTYFYFFLEILNKKTYLNLILFTIAASFLILTRGEFFIFYIFTLLYFLYPLNIRINRIVISIFLTLVLISPYAIRNYNIFNTIVLTKSFGYNLLKGNNPDATVEGNESYIDIKFQKEKIPIEINDKYEINLDNFYKIKAIEFIKDEPLKYLKLYVLKVISFIFLDFNSTYPNYYNVAHIVPKLILSITALFGAIISLKRVGFFQYLSLFYFGNIFLFSMFFILPRYSVMMIPAHFLLSISFINYFFTNKKYKIFI